VWWRARARAEYRKPFIAAYRSRINSASEGFPHKHTHIHTTLVFSPGTYIKRRPAAVEYKCIYLCTPARICIPVTETNSLLRRRYRGWGGPRAASPLRNNTGRPTVRRGVQGWSADGPIDERRARGTLRHRSRRAPFADRPYGGGPIVSRLVYGRRARRSGAVGGF